jgi:hypothetical protein
MEAEVLIYSSGNYHFYGPLKSLSFRGFFFDHTVKLPSSAEVSVVQKGIHTR